MAAAKMPMPKEGEEQATLFSWARMKTYSYPTLFTLTPLKEGRFCFCGTFPILTDGRC